MHWLSRLFRVEVPPPPPDTSATLARMQESRAHIVAHTDQRRREAAAIRLEQTHLRHQLRTNPLADDLFGGRPA